MYFKDHALVKYWPVCKIFLIVMRKRLLLKVASMHKGLSLLITRGKYTRRLWNCTNILLRKICRPESLMWRTKHLNYRPWSVFSRPSWNTENLLPDYIFLWSKFFLYVNSKFMRVCQFELRPINEENRPLINYTLLCISQITQLKELNTT